MGIPPKYRSVLPVRPVAPYIGGKKHLSAQLVEIIDAIDHETYAEPFVGMGGVFLRRRRAPACEVVNDVSGDVATFFRILQRHYVPFMDMLKFQLTSRKEFDRLMAVKPETLTDLERAARFLYLQRLAYGGKVSGRNFGVVLGDHGRFDVTRLAPLLTDLNERLAGVVIENLHYKEFIDRYDTLDTLFYLDPPYFGSEDYYGPDTFSRNDFIQLAAILRGIKGQFIFSINDASFIRETFCGFEFEETGVVYTFNGAHKLEAKELIITSPGLHNRARAQNSFI